LVERARRADPTFRLPSWGPEREVTGAAEEPDQAFRPINFASLAGQEPPERRFVVKEWVPAGCVTGLWGEGGIGKSMLAQEIATLVATGCSTIGFEVEAKAPVVAIFAEDDRDELWRRQVRINAALGIGMEGLGDLHLQGRAGLENTLALYPPGRPPAAQALMGQITAACERYRPGLVILDNNRALGGVRAPRPRRAGGARLARPARGHPRPRPLHRDRPRPGRGHVPRPGGAATQRRRPTRARPGRGWQKTSACPATSWDGLSCA
jgi:hypothetical protein